MSNLRTGSAFALAACALIGGFEGLRQTAYRDVVGVPTICYGETKNVRMGMRRTKPECDEMLVQSLIGYDDGLMQCLKPERRDLADGVHLAMLSVTYNIGIGAFCHSTMARRINAGDIKGACNALLAWNKAGGVPWPGLTRRRQAERKICLEGLPT